MGRIRRLLPSAHPQLSIIAPGTNTIEGSALIRQKGARAWAPFVCEERARLAQCLGDAAAERHLREAHRLFTEMGATGHAERLARELSP